MRFAAIATGDELMRGRALDTHLQFFARRLAPLGHEIGYHATVGDVRARIVEEIRLAASRADVVLLSGGLGPTQDDHTREAASEAFGAPLEFRPAAMRAIAARFKRHGIPMAAANRKQAFVPAGARLLPNPNGSAPGFLLKAGRVLFAALPGPSREMMPMFDRHVLPRLPRAADAPEMWEGRTYGIPEGSLDELIGPIIRRVKGSSYGTTVAHGTVNMWVKAPSVASLDRALRRALGGRLFFRPLEEEVAALLLERKATIALAESCTGGLISHLLTQVPGVSRALLESLVVYSNESKVARLGVARELIARHGAVSEEVARAMAEGAARTSKADVGVGVTGIAGPDGGTPKKPVGLVWHAVAYRGRTTAVMRVFPGERAHVKERAAYLALDMIRRALA